MFCKLKKDSFDYNNLILKIIVIESQQQKSAFLLIKNLQYNIFPMRITPNQSDIQEMISKFIINLPPYQLKQDRIWIHLQKMFYYFVDQVVDLQPLNDFQQQDKQMKQFFALVIQKLPSFLKLQPHKILKLINDGYSNTPVFGVIIYNLDQTKILLVQSHKPANMFGIPKGKINQGQTPIQCACRQVKQQVGINVHLSQHHKIQIFYSKSCCFYICKMQQNNINVSFVKNTQAQKLKGKKKTSKQIKSLVWLQLHNPEQLRLNVATKKVIDKLRSDKAIANSSRNINNGNGKNNNGKNNGYNQNQQRGRKNRYVQVPNQQTSPLLYKQQPPKSHFDSYSIKNRKFYQKLFFTDTD